MVRASLTFTTRSVPHCQRRPNPPKKTKKRAKPILRSADLVQREGRALVLGMNKWDLMEGKPAGKLRAEADHWLPQVKGVPIVAVSGRLGEGLDRLMQAVTDAHAVWNRRVPTNTLNP